MSPFFLFTLLPFLSFSYTITRNALTDLTSTDLSAFTTQASQWTVTKLKDSTKKVYNCANIYYLGGHDLTTPGPTFSKTFTNLPPHDIIHYSFYFSLLDSWDANQPDIMQIKFGTVLVKAAYGIGWNAYSGSNICGNTGYRDLIHYQVQGRVAHNSSSLTLEVLNQLTEDSSNESLGFRDILLVFLTNTSERAQEVYAQAPVYGLPALKYDCVYNFDKNSCSTCHENCTSCYGSGVSQCFACKDGYFFDGDTCMLCFYHPGDTETCHSCEYPLIPDPKNKYGCVYPCGDGEVVWSDGTCHKMCQYPLLLRTYPKGGVCEEICGGDTGIAKYSYDWGQRDCYDYCPAPLRDRCDGPLCGEKICGQCIITSDCGEGYVCNTTIGGFCLLNVEYKLTASLVKSITNGYTILVQVNPPQDLIKSIDDVLQITVDLLNNDYQVAVKNTNLGVFQVQFTALRQLQGISLIKLGFNYSPTRLKLTTQMSLPNVVFISEGIAKAAESIGSASNVSSYVFIVCIVCFAVLGNMNKVWSSLIINQYMHYLLFLSVEYLTPTQTYLESLGNYSLVFFQGKTDSNTDPDLLKDLRLAWPQKFIDENYPINLFQSTKQIFLILGLMSLTVMVARLVLGRNNYFVQVLLRIAKKLRWNGLLQQTLTYSLPLMLASLMQINLMMFSKQSTWSSFGVALGCLIFLVVFFGKSLMLISNIPPMMLDRVLYSDRYGALWRGLNLKTRWSRFYYWVIGARGVFLAYVIAFLGLFPYVQVVSVVIYQCVVISFYFQGPKPAVFVDRILNRFSLLAEFLLLIMKVMILAFKMVKDRSYNDQIITYSALGIVGVGIFIQMLLLGFSVFMQIKNRKQVLRSIKDVFRALSGKEKKVKIRRLARRQQRKGMKVSHVRIDNSDNSGLGIGRGGIGSIGTGVGPGIRGLGTGDGGGSGSVAGGSIIRTVRRDFIVTRDFEAGNQTFRR